MAKYFYDTCALLDSNLAQLNDILISSITLKELENIKTSIHKDNSIKVKSRLIQHWLEENPDKFEIICYRQSMGESMQKYDFELTDDIRILSCAYFYKVNNPDIKCYFVTNDLSLKHIAIILFGKENVLKTDYNIDNYTGFKKIIMNEEELAHFYNSLTENNYDLLTNEYLMIYNENNELIDTQRWDGISFHSLTYKTLDSIYFGRVKPIANDPYQACLVDSFVHNQITLVKGSAGTGKSYLALAYLFNQLEKHKIDKIIIFCNTVATKNSAHLGFYPGTKDEKLLDSQIGNFLNSKFGDSTVTERLINENKLILLPLSDARGYDTTGMNAGVYITEAQNMDISLMKLALQRIGEDSIVILDGDDEAQVDLQDYEGDNNGLKRVSQIFRGNKLYGEIALQQIHRSKIAELADKL